MTTSRQILFTEVRSYQIVKIKSPSTADSFSVIETKTLYKTVNNKDKNQLQYER